MTRFFLFILYYVIAFCLGFAVRARYDGWMYAKPHMQSRLRIFSQELMLYDPDPVPEAEQELFFPPSTTDPLAFNEAGAMRAVRARQAELDAEYEKFAEQPAAAETGDVGGDGEYAGEAAEAGYEGAEAGYEDAEGAEQYADGAEAGPEGYDPALDQAPAADVEEVPVQAERPRRGGLPPGV